MIRLTFFVLFLFFLAGCNRSYSGARAEPVMAEGPRQRLDFDVQGTVEISRLVTYAGRMELAADEPDTTLARLPALAEGFGGYASSADRYAVTLRIPSDRLETAMDAVATYGKVVDRSISSLDVTDNHRDLTLRLDNAERSRQRYLELLAKAESVEETLAVERELERITERIELMRGELNALDGRIALSTLRVAVRERVRPGPIGYIFAGLYEGVKWLFVRN